jgi:two-component system NtrC family sensor kinase
MNATKPLLFLAMLISFRSLAQDSLPPAQAFHISKLPHEGILLEKGWKFHPGDNTEWSNPDLDDSKWQIVALPDYNSYIPQLKNRDIGWFRINLVIDSSFLKTQLAIQLTQLGASEVYLNGKLFQQFGLINSPLSFKSFNPAYKPFLLPGNIGNKITIAIRFVSHIPSKTWLFTGGTTKRSPLALTLNTWNNALTNYKTILENAGIAPVTYMFLVLALLFLLLFAFFPKEKINLLFGLFCFFLVTNSILTVQLTHGNFDINKFGLLSFIIDSNGATVGILMLLIISRIVLHRITIYLLLLFSGMGIIMFLFFFFGPVYPVQILDFILHIVTVITFFYLSVYAFRQRNYLIGIVALNSGLINVILILILYSTLNLNSIILLLAFAINFILITFYVSINFARKSKNLEEQLVEIKNLSQENLNKELEKQQILASQNENLEQQVMERTIALTRTIEELKSAQSQLIQSEKMASLGELTAGIAHEIQNPLNFVNNFSDVNTELVDELKTELSTGNTRAAIEIADNIKENEQKINHHGNRADAIVKGMLQHSRASSGQKEPTDINALADEYLRLAYHGLRAKDKSFNADFKTDLDDSIGKINIIPQDIGRVVLNLINNAFYAVDEKRRLNQNGFEPIVTVSTTKNNGRVEIKVSDNGNGIQQKVLDKIFQPFFTTKPTGQGTGLGLSLSYDIVKAHGGEIKVETMEGSGTAFIIQLPFKPVG